MGERLRSMARAKWIIHTTGRHRESIASIGSACLAMRRHELLSRVVFRGPGSGGVLQDSVGENFSFENKNDLLMPVESSPTSAG